MYCISFLKFLLCMCLYEKVDHHGTIISQNAPKYTFPSFQILKFLPGEGPRTPYGRTPSPHPYPPPHRVSGAWKALKCLVTLLWRLLNFILLLLQNLWRTLNLHSSTNLLVCYDTCSQSIRYISFHHVRENTKIFTSTHKANGWPFHCAMPRLFSK